jgi:hypothetical protein
MTVNDRRRIYLGRGSVPREDGAIRLVPSRISREPIVKLHTSAEIVLEQVEDGVVVPEKPPKLNAMPPMAANPTAFFIVRVISRPP